MNIRGGSMKVFKSDFLNQGKFVNVNPLSLFFLVIFSFFFEIFIITSVMMVKEKFFSKSFIEIKKGRTCQISIQKFWRDGYWV